MIRISEACIDNVCILDFHIWRYDNSVNCNNKIALFLRLIRVPAACRHIVLIKGHCKRNIIRKQIHIDRLCTVVFKTRSVEDLRRISQKIPVKNSAMSGSSASITSRAPLTLSYTASFENAQLSFPPSIKNV